jgi:hypothetical protein
MKVSTDEYDLVSFWRKLVKLSRYWLLPFDLDDISLKVESYSIGYIALTVKVIED